MLPSSELLHVIEEGLAGHRAFGDSAYILDRFHHCSRRRLRLIARRRRGAKHLLSALTRADDRSRSRVLGHTVVRSAIQHAHVQIETGEGYGLPQTDCENIFEATAQHLAQRKPRTPFEATEFALPRIGEQPHNGWIWSEEYPDDIFGRAFRFLVSDNWGDLPATPSKEDIAALKKGARLLHTLMPQLTRSAFSHVQVVSLFNQGGGWKQTASSSQFRVGGAIFLARTLLRDPWMVAEHLLHESLHHKLYDFRHGHSLLEVIPQHEGAMRITSPWNPENLNGANQWDVHRVYAAFHVYVQLIVLSQLARHRATELEKVYGPSDGLIDPRRAFERAWYLGEQLKGPAWELLGLAGQKMVDWLISILELVAPARPPQGAYLHLVLDLYQREARGGVGAAPAVVEKLDTVAKEEVETARAILSGIGQQHRLDEGMQRLPERASLEAVREAVAKSILDAAPDGYVLPAAADDANERVRQMVLHASERLYATLQRIPYPVASARRRAYGRKFNVSCVDEVGRLLATLAAAVPPRGRILEIGTGVGVGTAWIAAGLGKRTDVEVISVEVDRELSDEAAKGSWPPYVRLVTGDALQLLATLGTFDLVFVDAGPVKHGHVDSTIPLLRPAGVLLVDDLHVPRGNNRDEQKALQDALRRLVMHRPELQAVELDWASGVILATRRVDVTADPIQA
jgi:predicted O-methyltransferase YrrM